MPKISTILAILAFFYTQNFIAQTAEKKLAAAVYIGASDYYGELNTQFFNTDKALRVQGGARVLYYLNSSFHAGIDIGFGGHGQLTSYAHYRAKVWKGNGHIRYELNNGYLLPENAKLQPYIFVGAGFANTFVDLKNKNVPGLDFTFNTGFGVNYKINDFFSLNYNTNWAITNHDNRDKVVLSPFNDMFMIHTIGVVIPIARLKDADGDGVHDGRDRCPNTPLGVPVDMLGCPNDQDNDGVADYQDMCVNEAGLPSAFGCPDKDDDGVPNAEDKCPDMAGSRETGGCPDRDLDGVLDADDACPDIKGSKETNGCPDTDGDGVVDNEDTCPDVKGLVAFKGCPDTDGDGVPDDMDDCPKVKGTIANKGCPQIEESTKKVFERALKGIQFETGKSIIKPSSFNILNEVVDILKINLDYQMQINGHTDNQGDEIKNLLLSQERAMAVKVYLIDKGISANRLNSEGFGATQPKTSNDTSEGRAINRRVEFVVKFEE